MSDNAVEQLDAIAAGEKLTGAYRRSLREPNSFFARQQIEWRGSTLPLAEHVAHAVRLGLVAREQILRGIVIDGEIQYVVDPSLQVIYGVDEGAHDRAILDGHPDGLFAHDLSGNRIPLLSARFPRPQRRHRPEPEQPDEWQPDDVEPPTPAPARQWQGPNDPLPPYARGVIAPAPVKVTLATPSSPPAPKPRTALQQDLYEHLARGPKNPRSRALTHNTNIRADDPPERGA